MDIYDALSFHHLLVTSDFRCTHFAELLVNELALLSLLLEFFHVAGGEVFSASVEATIALLACRVLETLRIGGPLGPDELLWLFIWFVSLPAVSVLLALLALLRRHSRPIKPPAPLLHDCFGHLSLWLCLLAGMAALRTFFAATPLLRPLRSALGRSSATNLLQRRLQRSRHRNSRATEKHDPQKNGLSCPLETQRQQ